LPPRPGQPPIAPTSDGGDPPDAKRACAKTSPAKVANPTAATPQSLLDPVCPPEQPPVRLEDLPQLPEDIETRPDGTPGNLTAYAPKAPVAPYIPPREAPIMVALATRPKPWRMVNVPKDQAPTGTVSDTNPPAAALQEPERQVLRGLVDLRERIFTGDALATFAATRIDPDAPIEPMQIDSDAFTVELELISTGGDPAAEAEQAAMKAAHPEGKPIVTFRYGTELPSDVPPNGKDDAPPDG
jgi:hypothetical protein